MPPACRTIPTRSRSSRGRAARVVAEDGDDAARCARGSPRGSRPSSSCRRRWARAGRRPRRGRPRSRCPGPPRRARRTCEDLGRGSPGRAPRLTVEPCCCACIDIGSNTTRLLVAGADDGGLREVLQQRAFTRMGSAGAEIAPEKVDRGRRGGRATQVRLARESGADASRAVGTARAAARPATARSCSSAIEREAGIEVDVLTGDEEARYAFIGATRTLGHAAAGRGRGGRRRRRLDRARLRHARRRRRLVGVLPRRLGLARRRLPALGPARRPTSSSACAATSPASSRASTRRARRCAYAVGGSATSLRRLVGGVLDHETLAARASACSPSRPAAEVARALRAAPRARAAAAGGDPPARRGGRRAGRAAADRARRPARGRAARRRSRVGGG